MDIRGEPRRWIVVADSPFLPAQGGGEREHLGFVQAAVAAGWLSALVIPTDPDPSSVGRHDDLSAIAELVTPAPVVTIPRQRGLRAARVRQPYVVASRPVPKDLTEQLRALAPNADAVIVFSYKSHEIGRALAEGLGLPAVLRQHNLEGPYHRALAASAKPPRSWAVRLEAARIERDERRLEQASWLTGIADISAADADVRAARAAMPVSYVPTFMLGPRAAAGDHRWQSPAEPAIVFVGALDVATNHDAIAWFADQVWPLILSAEPKVRWQVVGRKPTDWVTDLIRQTPRAELHPDVADPGEYIRRASVAVNPTVSGSGVNIKLVEYLSMGIPVVSTVRGQAGLGLEPGKDLLAADAPGEFARQVVDLLGSADFSQRIGTTGRLKALRILDVETSLRTMASLLPDRT